MKIFAFFSSMPPLRGAEEWNIVDGKLQLPRDSETQSYSEYDS